jgi:hypothetical protein
MTMRGLTSAAGCICIEINQVRQQHRGVLVAVKSNLFATRT